MARFILGLANSEDDAKLQEIIQNSPMDGKIKLSFARHPSFFHGAEILGDSNEVIVARDTYEGTLVALAIRSLRNAHINGNEQKIGYLSGLRIESAYRNGTILARGYRFLRQLHENNPVPFYLAAIAEENVAALKTFASEKRPAIPISQDMGRYCTLVYCIKNNSPGISSAGLEIRQGGLEYLAEVRAFINGINSKRQFAPYYREEDFFNQSLFRGLSLDDFFLAFRRGHLVGVMAKWDQRNFKQIRIAGYDWKLNLLRPAVNLISKAKGLPRLPKSGSLLNYFYVSFLAISPDDPDVFVSLFNHLHYANSKRDYSLVMLGIHSEDPLFSVAKRFPHLQYDSRLWMMYWPEQQREAERVNRKMIPFVELATL